MNARLATQEDETNWNALASNNFLQSWEWGQMHELLGNGFWRVVVEDAGKLVACALIVKRELPLGRCWMYVPYGPVFAGNKQTAWTVLQEKIVEIAKQERALYIRIDPLENTTKKPDWLEDTWTKADREVQPQHTAILDLTPTEEELLSDMHSKTRYNVRLAERKGVTVRFSSSLPDVDSFLKLSVDAGSRNNVRYHPDNYYRAMVSTLAPKGMLELAIAEYKGEVLAVHIMIYAGKMATYAHGASSSSYRALQAPTYLYWKTIQRAKEKGMTEYDFFGVAPPNANKNHPWAGITRMKQGFSGKPVSYTGAWDLVLDESFYTAISVIRKIKSFWR